MFHSIESPTARALFAKAYKAAAREDYHRAYTLSNVGLGLVLHKIQATLSSDENYHHCSQPMSRVINAGQGRCTGFLCEICRHFEPSIGREKRLPPDPPRQPPEVSHESQ